jgi:hypothetical protein
MFKLFFEMSMLAVESQQALWLRGARLVLGGSEAERMVGDKVAAAQQAAAKLMTGATPYGIVRV